jgi:ABC-2 type transport system ATP-binding protein
MRLIAAITQPAQGKIHTNGSSTTVPGQLRALRKSIGYLPQNASWRESLTVCDFLHYFAWLRCMPRSRRSHAVESALQLTQLGPLRNRKLGALSGGESRRVMLAQALLHTPALLLLDEPTAGLDPSQRHHFRDVLASLRSSTSTLISTHLLEDVAELADDLLIVDAGRLLFQGSPMALSNLANDGSGSIAGMQTGYMEVLARGSVPG